MEPLYPKPREEVRTALGVYKQYFVSNEADSILKAIAKLQEEKELAQLAAEGHSESLNAIAAQLGVGFDGDVQTIFSAIHRMNLKYMNRIVELENEVRSLKEPLPECDRLSNAELIQIVRSLIKP